MSDLKLKCTKFDFCWGSRDPLTALKRPKVTEGKEGRREKGKERGVMVAPLIEDSGSGSGYGEGREKGKEESLGWGVHALLFSL